MGNGLKPCTQQHPSFLYEPLINPHILEAAALPWGTRVKIAIGTAQALAFLHSIKSGPLHRDLRMHNIMLDEQYNAKLFYLESNQQLVEDKIYRGEAIYLPPEYLETGQLAMNDVYTFGVILLELLTGSKDIAKCVNRQTLDDWTRPFFIGEIIDPRLGNDYPVNAAIQLCTLIRSCTTYDKKRRPVMQQVLDVLIHISQIKY
ncbi:unnamed protein product [Thlaspi arvense]|uniref:Protein kinase domain-containing protein n=1 Tax=Thlaspi arvense TaxID=13288 RepID=A0AAU9SUP2_THLAR|nr:unnamed protein product [Thlaspi arvense]